jgi:hypothetical protein
MKMTASLLTDLDEVERCRQVRRGLERVHRGLDGLCHWLESLQRRPQQKPTRRKNLERAASQQTRTSRSRG